MGFGPLRVVNEDRVSPGTGFGTHSHPKDSLGSGAVIRPGELQRMTAGTGVAHSEINASATEPVHFLQIRVMPDTDAWPEAGGGVFVRTYGFR